MALDYATLFVHLLSLTYFFAFSEWLPIVINVWVWHPPAFILLNDALEWLLQVWALLLLLLLL